MAFEQLYNRWRVVSICVWRVHVWEGHGVYGGHGGRLQGAVGRVATKEEWQGAETVFSEQCVLKNAVYEEQEERNEAEHELVELVRVLGGGRGYVLGREEGKEEGG